jgi:hypothetical protein
MLRYHMAVVTRDNRLKREIKRVTTATGSTADFIGDATGIDPAKPANLAIWDGRKADPDKNFLKKIPSTARISYVLEGDKLLDKLKLFEDERVTSLLCHDARFDEDEFIASATKALRGDVFGLQKYFPWGVTTFSMRVTNANEKSRAIEILMRYAKLAGVRGPVRDRIQTVADELMMNALYHAPVDEDGNERFAGKSPRELAQLDELPAIQVQYGCSGQYFGIAVRDGGGSLTRPRTLQYLRKAREGAYIEDKKTGAGLGLVSVLRSVSKLVFNLDAGYSTEVIGLFDMDLFAKGKVGARSLHIFNAADDPAGGDDEEEEEAEEAAASTQAAAPSSGGFGKWLLVALLSMVVASLATAVIMKKMGTKKADAASVSKGASVSVYVPAADKTTVQLNGKTIAAGTTRTIDNSKANKIVVTRKGFKPFEKVLPKGSSGAVELHVALEPSR